MHQIIFGVRYLDPGSGSLLIQLIAAGFLGGIGILIKVFWGRLKAFFKGEKYVPPVVEDEDEIEPEE